MIIYQRSTASWTYAQLWGIMNSRDGSHAEFWAGREGGTIPIQDDETYYTQSNYLEHVFLVVEPTPYWWLFYASI